MNKLQKDGPEEVVYKGKIFEVVKQPMKAGEKKMVFESARRSPGTRLLIVKNNQMLITKEFRSELDDFDYRLPGGKVFDTLDEYDKHLNDDILPLWDHRQQCGIRKVVCLLKVRQVRIKYYIFASIGQ